MRMQQKATKINAIVTDNCEMPFQIRNIVVLMILWIPNEVSSTDEAKKTPAVDFCQNESFQPRCLKNEVIVVKSAIYGRMRIGRCITNEEVAAFLPHFGENSPNIGCSADILDFMDRNCFAKEHCEVRVVDISAENVKPCFPILNVYLEVTYDCISVADEDRSCFVTASRNPVHINGLSKKICGTESHPWHVEVPNGQRINVTLIESTASNSDDAPRHNKKSCPNRGFILDKIGRRNTTICRDGRQREKELYLSTGNTLDIITEQLQSTGDDNSPLPFLLKLEAVGCSDIIPPEDAWLKRKDDAVVIGCYSNRQTWHLSCKGGKWMGVLGNCSQDNVGQVSVVEPELTPTLSSNGEVLAIVAVCGFTLAICLAIVCIGAVCLRRLYSHMKKRDRQYKTINYSVNTTVRSQTADRPLPFGVVECSKFSRDEVHGFDIQPPLLHPLNEAPAADYNVSPFHLEDPVNRSA